MNPTDIANMVEGIENRMVCFITRLRARHTIGPQLRRICLKSRMEDTPMHHPACYARGMGLLIGVKGSKAYFNIYFPANQLMDIVIEIDGPNGEYYTERITVRSPRRKECHSNTSETFTMDFKNELTSGRVINIPVEYEIFPRKIAVNYTPPSSGRYHLSLISRGQHIFGSPFKVMVDNESSSAVVSQRKFLGTGILRNDSNRNLFDLDNCDLQLMTPLDDQLNGIIIKKKLLKTIVFRQYADIVLLGDEALPQDPRAWMSTSVSSDNDSNFLDWSSVLNDSMTTCKSDEVLNNFDMPTTKSPDSIQLHEISYEQLHSEENEEHNIMDDLEHESNANVSEEKLSEDDDDDDKYSSKSTIPIYEFQNDENSDHLQQSHIANVDEPDMPLSFLSQDLKTDTTSVTSEDNENSENNDILINRGNDIYSLSEVSNGSLNDNTKSPFTDGVKGISAELNRLYKSYQPKMSENGFRSRNDNIINQMSKIDFDEPVSMHVTTSTRVTPDTVCPPRTKCTSFGGHVGGGISARVPEALINDWVDLWNHDGEGIVTNLVRQYEQILNSYKDGRPSPSLNHTDSE